MNEKQSTNKGSLYYTNVINIYDLTNHKFGQLPPSKMMTNYFGKMSGCGGKGKDSERGTEAIKLSIEKEKEAFV